MDVMSSIYIIATSYVYTNIKWTSLQSVHKCHLDEYESTIVVHNMDRPGNLHKTL